ncbi:aldose epimerase family protein [Clostridium sp. DL1XJH146]
MQILKEVFGSNDTGETIFKYKLINEAGAYVGILNYGGVITDIFVPDKDGTLENVVLSFDNMGDYLNKSPFFGALTGRHAGRITDGAFQIDETVYLLEKNNFNSNLHSGPISLANIIWDVEEIQDESCVSLNLTYLSPDGESGFPGNLDLKVTYSFDNDNNLKISYVATSDKKTIVNLTNHSYFNLSGNLKEDILNHNLTVPANEFCCIDDKTAPTGEIKEVENTPFDFRTNKKIGLDIAQDYDQINFAGGYDHPFVLNKENDNEKILLSNPTNGRTLSVQTDQSCVVIYTANALGNELILSGGVESKNHLAICLETQHYPDAINQDNFPTYILNPFETYSATTLYSFGCEK